MLHEGGLRAEDFTSDGFRTGACFCSLLQWLGSRYAKIDEPIVLVNGFKFSVWKFK